MENKQADFLEQILDTVPDGAVENIVIGKHWTAVSIQSECQHFCGMASTIQPIAASGGGHFSASADGKKVSARQMASRLSSDQPALAGIAAAALNALLQIPFINGTAENDPDFDYSSSNAEKILLENALKKRVALVGHFPFTDKLRSAAGHLDVLEFRPRPGDLPAEMAPEVLPSADLIAITGMTWVNGTLPDLLDLCPPTAEVMLLGASTPLSPVLFTHGIDYLSGALVKEIDPVMQAVAAGAVYRQIMPLGLQLVTLRRRNSR